MNSTSIRSSSRVELEQLRERAREDLRRPVHVHRRQVEERAALEVEEQRADPALEAVADRPVRLQHDARVRGRVDEHQREHRRLGARRVRVAEQVAARRGETGADGAAPAALGELDHLHGLVPLGERAADLGRAVAARVRHEHELGRRRRAARARAGSPRTTSSEVVGLVVDGQDDASSGRAPRRRACEHRAGDRGRREAVLLLQVLTAARLARRHRPHPAAHEAAVEPAPRRSSRRRASRGRRRRSAPRPRPRAARRPSSATRSSTGEGLKLETTATVAPTPSAREQLGGLRPPPWPRRRARPARRRSRRRSARRGRARKRPSRPGTRRARLARRGGTPGPARSAVAATAAARLVVVGRAPAPSSAAGRASRPRPRARSA